MLFTPSPCHKLSHLLGPPPPSSVTYFMEVIQCNCNIIVVSWIQHLVNKIPLSDTIFSISLFKNVRLTGSRNVLHFSLKCSQSRRFLGLSPRSRFRSLRRSPDSLVVRGVLPSAIAVSSLRRLRYVPLAPQTKIPAPLAPKYKILEPPLRFLFLRLHLVLSLTFFLELKHSVWLLP